MSERREKIHIEHELTKTRRCELLDVARSSAYYHPEPVSEADLALMRLIDEIHLQRPFYGSRRTRDELEDRGHKVNRKRVQRLMRLMDLRALYPRRRTSQPGKGHKIYPYLLRELSVEHANQAWATDICYSAPSPWRRPGRRCQGLSMSGMHFDFHKDEGTGMPAICYEVARAEAEVTCRTLAG
jgi:putative transposase